MYEIFELLQVFHFKFIIIKIRSTFEVEKWGPTSCHVASTVPRKDFDSLVAKWNRNPLQGWPKNGFMQKLTEHLGR